MAAYPGAGPIVLTSVGAPFVGPNPNGSTPVFNQWTSGAGGRPQIQTLTLVGPGGESVADGGGGAKPAAAAYPATSYPDNPGFGSWFYEKIHILPKNRTIDFGTILTQVEDEYEIYNAFRKSNSTENAIVNPASPGVQFPNNSPPVVVPPQTSMLDPTTTDNSGGTGLGTIVKLKVQALQDGLPSFEARVDFQFISPANDVWLDLSGSRIVLIPYRYEIGFRETLEFYTDRIETRSGKRQAISTRKRARQMFEVVYALDDVERQGLQILLFDWQDNLFGFPLWHEAVRLTAAASIGATTYTVSGADTVDFRVGGLAAVIQDDLVYDVLRITSVSATSIGASDPSVNAYAVGTEIMPVRTALISSDVPIDGSILNLEQFLVRWSVCDNDTGAPAGSTSGWSTYNSRVLFDDCNVVDGSAQGALRRRVHVLDSLTGKFRVVGRWDRSKRSGTKTFSCRTRAQILALRKLWLALRGPQVACYLPTFRNDLTVVANLSSGVATMDIRNVGYTRFAKSRLPYTVMKIAFTDGTTLIRVVQSSVIVSTTVERLTLDTTWPSTKTPAEVVRVQFYDLVAFDGDRLTLTHHRLGHATAEAPVIAVFDDN